MRLLCCLLAVMLATASGVAQDDKKKDKKTSPTRYKNAELGIDFAGVYGWDSKRAEGSGAWTELARWKSDPQLDSTVLLLVRDNPFETSADLRKSLDQEFKSGGDPTQGAPVYKEVQIRPVDMKRGLKLPGFEVEAFVARVNEEGKMRERFLLSRTFFGRNRLFRIHCSAKRSRAKRVRSTFESALVGLTVTAEDEKVARGTPFVSRRGRYTLIIPEGMTVVLPPRGSHSDMRFDARRRGIHVTLYSYQWNDTLAAHVDQMVDHYGDDLKLENEDAKVLGGDGYIATVTKGDKITLIVGAVVNDRVYRIHTTADKKKLEEAKQIHAAVQKTFAPVR